MKTIVRLMALVAVMIAGGATLATAQETSWKHGDHTYTLAGKIDRSKVAPGKYNPTAWMTFTHVPSDYEEFEALYNDFLGLSPHGTAAMIVLAMEMFARDPQVGTECMDLLCGRSASMGNLRILKTKFPKPGETGEGDNYIQRYLPAASLKGATAKNAYTPEYPYTVEMCSHTNAPQGDYTFIYILGHGWDIFYRPATVKLLDDGHYQLVSCSSVYSQCQNIKGKWQGLK